MKGSLVSRCYCLSWIFLVVIIVSGCGKGEFVCESTPAIPGGSKLEAGDIILARCGGFLPAVFGGFGATYSGYGHAGVLFYDSDGCSKILHMQPCGLAVSSLEDFWEKYYKVGLVRLRIGNLLNRDKFNNECQKLLEYNDEHIILNDFWTDEGKIANYKGIGYPNSLYCVTLINMLYYKSGAPEPFVKKFNIEQYPIMKLIGEALDRKEYNIPVVASVFQNSNFSLIGEFSFSEQKLMISDMDNAIVSAVNEYLSEGYITRGAPLIKRPYLATVLGVKTVATPFLPVGIKVMLKKIDSYKELSQLYMINKFIKNTRNTVLQNIAADSNIDVFKHTTAVADEYRDKYFVNNLK